MSEYSFGEHYLHTDKALHGHKSNWISLYMACGSLLYKISFFSLGNWDCTSYVTIDSSTGVLSIRDGQRFDYENRSECELDLKVRPMTHAISIGSISQRGSVVNVSCDVCLLLDNSLQMSLVWGQSLQIEYN